MGQSSSSSSNPPRSIPSKAEYKQFRAPKEDRSALIEPELKKLGSYAQKRHDDVASGRPALSMGGIAQCELMDSARASLIAMARDWTSSYTRDSLPEQKGPIILSGHQPELFHPGVWFKNFALSEIAKSVDGIGIHLLIDSDLCRDVTVRIPTMRDKEPHVESIPFDAIKLSMPFEERQFTEEPLRASFMERLNQASALEHEPLLNGIWPNVCQAAQQGRTIGEALSQGRHQIELAHNHETLELPFSKVCDTDPFRYFLIEILSRIEAFQSAYNEALARYRAAHKLRSEAQPLPNLTVIPNADDSNWSETPFWIWSKSHPTRRALWCQRRGKQLLLTNLPNEPDVDQQGVAKIELALPADEPALAIQQLQAARDEGIKIRSRALTTTLYCRHLLADLFLHGIGGAKYDQVTDDLSQQFFGIAPPPYATLTATIRLFDEMPKEPTPAARRELEQKLRSYRYHPERWLNKQQSLTPEQHEAIALKQRWIETKKTAENASERHQAIEQANQVLFKTLAADRNQAEQELAALKQELRMAPYYTSREYSFVLFAEDKLVSDLQTLARSNK